MAIHEPPEEEEEDFSADEQEESNPHDDAAFMREIEEYPLYRQMQQILVSSGYGPGDPLSVFLQITTAYARDQRLLSNRSVSLHAAHAQQLADMQAEVTNLADAMDEQTNKTEQLEKQMILVNQQAENLTKTLALALPAMERIQTSTSKTMDLLETKSGRAIVILFAAGALVFCAGFLVALGFK